MNAQLNLQRAQARVVKAAAAVAKDDLACSAIDQEIAALIAKVAQLRQHQAEKHLHEALADAERALVAAEEDAIKTMAIELAGAIVKKQMSDPVRNCRWVSAQVTRLRTMIRSELDTPITEKYSRHPVIVQALALLPPLDDTDRPVAELGYVVQGQTDWHSRRKAILAESTPLEAA